MEPRWDTRYSCTLTHMFLDVVDLLMCSFSVAPHENHTKVIPDISNFENQFSDLTTVQDVADRHEQSK